MEKNLNFLRNILPAIIYYIYVVVYTKLLYRGMKLSIFREGLIFMRNDFQYSATPRNEHKTSFIWWILRIQIIIKYIMHILLISSTWMNIISIFESLNVNAQSFISLNKRITLYKHYHFYIPLQIWHNLVILGNGCIILGEWIVFVSSRLQSLYNESNLLVSININHIKVNKKQNRKLLKLITWNIEMLKHIII